MTKLFVVLYQTCKKKFSVPYWNGKMITPTDTYSPIRLTSAVRKIQNTFKRKFKNTNMTGK